MKPLSNKTPYDGLPIFDSLVEAQKLIPKVPVTIIGQQPQKFLLVSQVRKSAIFAKRTSIAVATKDGQSYEITVCSWNVDDLWIHGSVGALQIPNSAVTWLKARGYKLTTNR